MLEISIKQNAHNKIAAKLRELGQALTAPRGLYARWGVTALRWIDENFRKQGGLLEDGSWEGLSSSTLRSRARKEAVKARKQRQKSMAKKAKRPKSSKSSKSSRKGGVKKAKEAKKAKSQNILIVTGDLRRSYTTKFDSEGVVIGSNKDYAVYHESDEPRNVLPQRRMLPRQRDTSFTSRMQKVALSYIREQLRRRS